MEDPCLAPRPFPLSPDVCDTCGNLLSGHTTIGNPPRDADRAIWQVIIARGGIHDHYTGDLCPQQNPPFREHMAACPPNWKETTPPREDTVDRFTDTDARPDALAAIGGMLSCSCGRYRYTSVHVRDLTRGQLLWLALAEERLPAAGGL